MVGGVHTAYPWPSNIQFVPSASVVSLPGYLPFSSSCSPRCYRRRHCYSKTAHHHVGPKYIRLVNILLSPRRFKLLAMNLFREQYGPLPPLFRMRNSTFRTSIQKLAGSFAGTKVRTQSTLARDWMCNLSVVCFFQRLSLGLAPGPIPCVFGELLRSIVGPARAHGLSNDVSRDVLYNVAERSQRLHQNPCHQINHHYS